MFILSGPYNSAFLGKSLRNLNQLVIKPDNNVFEPFKNSYSVNNFSDYYNINEDNKILTSLEDALPYLYENFFQTHKSVQNAKRFKNKFDFRETIKDLHVGHKYKKLTEPTLIFDSKKAMVAKPISGISSNNVRVIMPNDKNILIEASQENPYLLEDYIVGREIAVDGYYDEYGTPVILNIMEHVFADQSDTSDTVYFTNVKLVEEFLSISNYLNDLSRLYGVLSNFPFHFEFRINENNKIIPIELNPLRFSGYGTCEIAHYAYNINPYKAFFKDNRPKWREKLKEHLIADTAFYGFYVAKSISSHDKLYSMFDEVLEYRIMPEGTKDAKVIVFFREITKNNLQKLALTKGIV